MQTESVNNSVTVEPLGNRYKLRFDDQVVQPSYYRFELQAIELAQACDLVEITIVTDGGSLATGIEVTNAILNSKAEVKGILRSSAHSCGSIIFLACHSHDIGVASEMLIHSGAGGQYGTPSQSVNRANSYKRQVRTLFETVYRGFLTPKELDLMIDEDKEYIFAEDEIRERLQNMYAYRDGQVKEYHQAIEDSMWAENNQVIDETLETLDFSDKEKEVFNKVRKALDDALMESENDDPVMENFLKYLEDKKEGYDTDYILKNIVDTEDNIVGYIEFKNTEEDGAEFLLGTEIVLTSWDEELIFSEEVVEEDKAKCLELLHTVTDKKFNKANKQRIYTSVLKYLTDVLDN